MRFGLHALGIGTGARREVLVAVARAAEANHFATLWSGEHVVMVDDPTSRYPYAPDGRIAVAPDADWLDPLVTLSWAAAVTSRIRLATGILLLPEHNPVLVAKQAASFDVLSDGRFTLGIGIGWSADEFAALGVPFVGRAERTAEYVRAIRTLWRDDVASFDGRFVRFNSVRVNPKPTKGRSIPIVVGGNSDAALARVATYGDGWYGFNLAGTDDLGDRIMTLRQQCTHTRRAIGDLEVAVAVTGTQPQDVAQLEKLGVTELVLVGAPPGDAGDATEWVDGLARQWSVASTAQ